MAQVLVREIHHVVAVFILGQVVLGLVEQEPVLLIPVLLEWEVAVVEREHLLTIAVVLPLHAATILTVIVAVVHHLMELLVHHLPAVIHLPLQVVVRAAAILPVGESADLLAEEVLLVAVVEDKTKGIN